MARVIFCCVALDCLVLNSCSLGAGRRNALERCALSNLDVNAYLYLLMAPLCQFLF